MYDSLFTNIYNSLINECTYYSSFVPQRVVSRDFFMVFVKCKTQQRSRSVLVSVRSVQSAAHDEMQHKDTARPSAYHYLSSGLLCGLMGCYTDANPGVSYIICLQWCCHIDHLLPPDKQSDLQKKAAAEMLLPYLSQGKLIPSCYHYINELIPRRGSTNVLV